MDSLPPGKEKIENDSLLPSFSDPVEGLELKRISLFGLKESREV
ncbi:MAG: hypothetical protein R8P61_21450 [Bacteroidia bacterium]|nr:hypothetical protein [Bacteroidia bacterium]